MTNSSTWVNSTVENTLRKPTSPNHNQSTYRLSSREPPSRSRMMTAATISRIRVRRDSVGAPTGGRMATGHAPVFGLRAPGDDPSDLRMGSAARRHALLSQLYGRGVGFPFGPRMPEMTVLWAAGGGATRLEVVQRGDGVVQGCHLHQLQARRHGGLRCGALAHRQHEDSGARGPGRGHLELDAADVLHRAV